jgi:hypothetical protein
VASLLKIEYFVKFFDLLVLISKFFFSSPAAKMPRTTASGDDAVVGQTVPSTIADPSKGTGTTRPASSSNVSGAENTDVKAMIVRPPPKFGARKLAMTRAST